MNCNYCGKPKEDKHPTIIVRCQLPPCVESTNPDFVLKEVYVCPPCASHNSIGDLLAQIGIQVASENAVKRETA